MPILATARFIRVCVILTISLAGFFDTTSNAQTLNWVFVSATGVPLTASGQSRPLYVYLTAPGEIYIDDVTVVAGSTTNGVNILTNGNFEAGSLSAWTIGSDGNNSASVAGTNFSHSGNYSMHLVAATGGTTQNSSIWQNISSALVPNATYTLGFWFRQTTNANGGSLVLRFSSNGIITTTNPAPQPSPPPPVQDTNAPVIINLTPAVGATVSNLTQIQVTFNKPVAGVEADDLTIGGNPADDVTGSGSNYVFTCTQPPAGTILIYWDIDAGITDLSGNLFNTSGSWTYTLIDNLAPAIVSTTPAASATVGVLAQAQVIFNEAVSGVDASSFLINGVAATNVSGSGLGPYVFQFAQPAPGPVQFSWAPGQNIRDAGSNLFGAAGWTATLNSSAAAAALTNIVINEFLAGNTAANGLLDEDGLLDSWIEIYNRGGTTVNLAGWSLTDDPDHPNAWTFPATNISGGQYVVLFASAKDRRVAGARLHTNFKLSLSSDYLGLFNAEYPPQAAYQFTTNYPDQRNNISYGRDNTNALRYFATPTPGGANGFSSISGVVSPLSASVNAGFFSQPTSLVLTTATAGVTILYTTNGSVPSISGGVTNGDVYIGPVPVTRTTALRATAFAPNLLPTLTLSRTYFFIEDIIRQPNNPPGYPTGNVWTSNPGNVQSGSRAYYQMDSTVVDNPQYTNAVRAGLSSIPTVSIMLPISDLFDPANGIYTHTLNRGDAWERACSMELIFPDGSPGRQIDCGLQIQGGSSRDPSKNAKHSFRVSFKSAYGPGKLDFPLFADTPVQKFNTLVLDGGINYWWHYVGSLMATEQRSRAQCVRDQFTSDLMIAMGNPAYHGKFYHLYLNGLYWGLHYLHERPDDNFAESYFGGDSSEFDVIKNTSAGTEIVSGNFTAWNAALSLATSALTNNAQYELLQQSVDVDNLIDYMIVNHWVGNDDWPHHNWYVIRNRVAATPFTFLVWDAEHVMKDVNVNVTTVTAAGSPAEIYNMLRNNAEFRLRFADHLQKHLSPGGVLYTSAANPIPDATHPERNVPAALYMKRITEITNAIVDESARWGGYQLTTNYTRNEHWLRELNNLLGYTNTPGNTANYFPLRSANVLNQYKSISLFPAVSAPVLNQLGGNVPAGFALTMLNQNGGGTIYYTTNGSDPRVYGSSAVTPGTKVYTNGAPLLLNRSSVIKSRVLSGGTWSAIAEGAFIVGSLGVPLRLTELMYNPIGGGNYEFAEVQNIGVTPLDIGGFSFQGITFTFPNGTIIQPGAVLLLANNGNASQFATRYPGASVFGTFGGSLDNSGERIAILDTTGKVVTEVTYNNAGGWPVSANGGGYSLELIDPYGDLNSPANWRASAAPNGTPGLPPATLLLNDVLLNEFMADNATVVMNGTNYPDWVELFNRGTNVVNLGNWSLSDSGNARKFIFPTNTLLATNSYLVLWCDVTNSDPGLHTGFALDRSGGNIFLYDAVTNRVDAISYGQQVTDFSLGRVTDLWQLTVPTTNAPNLAAALGSSTNASINEWLALGTNNWVELFNRSFNLPVALKGVYLSASNSLGQIRSLSFLPPRGFLQVFADQLPGPDHLDIKLSAITNTLVLYDASAIEIERINSGAQTNGISEGRFPDGTTNRYFMPIVTPGAANVIPNNPPVLSVITNRMVHLGQTVQLTAAATDPDSWYQSLTFSLTNSPAGTAINPTNGAFVWTVTNVPAPGTNSVTIRVTDNGTPALSDTKTFLVIVQPPLQFNPVTSGGNGNFNFSFNSLSGQSYQLEYKNNLADPQWTPLGSPMSGNGSAMTFTNNISVQPQRFYRIAVTSP